MKLSIVVMGFTLLAIHIRSTIGGGCGCEELDYADLCPSSTCPCPMAAPTMAPMPMAANPVLMAAMMAASAVGGVAGMIPMPMKGVAKKTMRRVKALAAASNKITRKRSKSHLKAILVRSLDRIGRGRRRVTSMAAHQLGNMATEHSTGHSGNHALTGNAIKTRTLSYLINMAQNMDTSLNDLKYIFSGNKIERRI